MSVGGPDEAAHHYETALELLADPDRALPDTRDLVSLVVRTSEAVTASGRPERARKIVQDQLRRLPPAAPDTHRARLLVALATAALLSESSGDALETTTEAIGLVPDEPTALRAKALGVHARAHLEHGHDEDAAHLAHRGADPGPEARPADARRRRHHHAGRRGPPARRPRQRDPAL